MQQIYEPCVDSSDFFLLVLINLMVEVLELAEGLDRGRGGGDSEPRTLFCLTLHLSKVGRRDEADEGV